MLQSQVHQTTIDWQKHINVCCQKHHKTPENTQINF